MDASAISVLNQIYAAINYMSELEGQDPVLVVEMSQAMINDAIERGDIFPMIEYVKRYCDVIDGPEDAGRIASDI
jgi:hypothetical protein